MSVLYLHFDNDDRNSRLARLQKSGAHVVVAEPRWPGFFELAKREKPYAIALDFSQAPSHSLETADYLSKAKETRDAALFLLRVPADRQEAVSKRLPAGHDPHGERALRKARPDGARGRGAGAPEEGSRRRGQEGGPGRRSRRPRGRGREGSSRSSAPPKAEARGAKAQGRRAHRPRRRSPRRNPPPAKKSQPKKKK